MIPFASALQSRIAARGIALNWDRMGFAVLAVLVGLVVATYRDYGISNDEEVQQVYGEKLIAFYQTGFEDRSALGFENLYLYGGLFDMIVVVVQRLAPSVDLYDIRHLLSGLIGVLGIAATWRLARLFAGPRAGFLALAFIALTAPWYGAMFNHTKDIPFAAAMTWLLYFSCRFAIEMPRPRAAAIAGVAIAGGAALGLRVGAILGFVYLATAAVIWAIATARAKGIGRATAEVGGMVWRLGLAAAVAYALMAFFWPWSVLAPLNPWIALKAFAHFKYNIDTLFDGQVMKMYAVPPSYAPVYFLVRMPILVLLGLGVGVAFGLADFWHRRRKGRDLGRDLARFLVMAATFLPMIFALVTRPYLFSGLRHFFFVVPPLMVLSALGYERLFVVAAGRRHAVVVGLAGMLGLGGIVQVGEMVLLHPHQYVSYNLLVGGLPGAIGRWDTDYWSNIAPEAAEGIVRLVAAEESDSGTPRPIYRIAICGAERALNEHLPPGFVATSRWDQADFFVSSTHIGCQRSYSRAPIIFTITRMGTTLGLVRDLRVLHRNRTMPVAPARRR